MSVPKFAIVAVTSDEHVYSKFALCPPEPVKLSDGGLYTPTNKQKWIWAQWLEYHDLIAELKDTYKTNDLIYCLNGDLVQGYAGKDTDKMIELIDYSPKVQQRVAVASLKPMLALTPKKIFMTRGTQCHVGLAGFFEEDIADKIEVERSKEADGTRVPHEWRISVYGLVFHLQHHTNKAMYGEAGRRKQIIAAGESLNGFALPDFDLRAHIHTFQDSGKQKPRFIVTPPWQLKNTFAQKVVPNEIEEVGAVIFVVADQPVVAWGGQRYQFIPFRRQYKQAPLVVGIA